MIEIRLTWAEMVAATMIGAMRQIQNLKAGRVDRFGCSPEDGWTTHIEGACGEMALAKCLGKFWSGSIGNLKADDVGGLQVRTRSRHEYELLLHDTDRDDRAYVLLTGRAPVFRIHGWIFGVDGKKPEWWKDPAKGRPAYFVPQSALHPVHTLGVAK